MPDWKRVKDTRTGHEFTVAVVNEEHHAVLDKPATNRTGQPLPAKPNIRKGSHKAAPKTAEEATK